MPVICLTNSALILQAQAERQVHLPALEIPAVIGGPEHAPGFAVQSTSRCHLLIDVHQQALGNHAGAEVEACLLHLKLVERLGMGELLDGSAEAQIAAERIKRLISPAQVSVPVSVPRRQLGLREYVAERVAQAAAARIDVALTALGSLADGRGRLGLDRGGEHERETGSEPSEVMVWCPR